MPHTAAFMNVNSWLGDLSGWLLVAGSPARLLLSAALFAVVAAAVAWLVAGVVVAGDPDLVERAPVGSLRAPAVVDAAVMGAFVGAVTPAPAAFAMLVGFWAVGSRIDLAVKRLPNQVTLPAAAGFAVALLPYAFGPSGAGWSIYFAGVVTYIAFYLLAIFSPASFGLGDVKLGLSVGLALGVFGSTAVAGGALAAFVAAGLSGLWFAKRHRVPARGLKVAFGPFLVAGALSGPVWAAVLGEGAV